MMISKANLGVNLVLKSFLSNERREPEHQIGSATNCIAPKVGGDKYLGTAKTVLL